MDSPAALLHEAKPHLLLHGPALAMAALDLQTRMSPSSPQEQSLPLWGPQGLGKIPHSIPDLSLLCHLSLMISFGGGGATTFRATGRRKAGHSPGVNG